MRPNNKTWWETAFPAVTWLRNYHRGWFRLDLLAGITLAAYLLPAALSDASLARLPPQAGLYACLFGGLVFWILCGSRQTSISVTSAISLVIGASLGEITGGNTTRFAALAAATALLVSLIAFIAWLARAGVMVRPRILELLRLLRDSRNLRNRFTCEFRPHVCPIFSKAAAMSAVRFLKGRPPHLPSRRHARQTRG